MELTIILVIVLAIGAFVWMGYNGSKNSKNNPTNNSNR
jgi:hypothetical protein